MIELFLANSDDRIIVTLNERVDIDDPFFLFEFTHITEKLSVKKVFAAADDLSTSKRRFNEFAIDTATVFDKKPAGQWVYRIYQQDNAANTDPASAGKMLESGKMNLIGSANSVFKAYDQPTDYITYKG